MKTRYDATRTRVASLPFYANATPDQKRQIDVILYNAETVRRINRGMSNPELAETIYSIMIQEIAADVSLPREKGKLSLGSLSKILE